MGDAAALETTDRFGFLPINRTIEFDGGRVEPVADLDARIVEVRGYTHADEVVFPPLVHYRSVVSSHSPEDALTLRPAPLFKLPVSHSITLRVVMSPQDFRAADGAFLVHFLGFLFSYRLQFENWWHDSKVPMHGRRWSLLREESAGPLLSNAYKIWRAWPRAERIRFTNLLYMHVRSFSYEWDWERFTLRYMVLDGCYRMARELGRLSQDVGHGARLGAMFRFAGMPTDATVVDKIVDLRNDLLHEALWDAGQPGAGSRVGIKLADDLWRINDRLLLRLVDYRGHYLSIPWWDIGTAVI